MGPRYQVYAGTICIHESNVRVHDGPAQPRPVLPNVGKALVDEQTPRKQY